MLGNLDLDLDVQVSATSTVRIGHSQSAQFQQFSRLSALRNRQPLASVEQRNLDFGPERRLRKRNRNAARQIVLVPLEKRMRLDLDIDVQVARRSAAWPGLAFAAQAKLHAVVDAGGDFHLELRRYAVGFPIRSSRRISHGSRVPSRDRPDTWSARGKIPANARPGRDRRNSRRFAAWCRAWLPCRGKWHRFRDDGFRGSACSPEPLPTDRW